MSRRYAAMIGLLFSLVGLFSVHVSACDGVELPGGGCLTLPVQELPIESQPSTDDQPIRAGAKSVLERLEGMFLVPDDDEFTSSFDRVMTQINRIINYLLGLLALIALVYLIYHGFLMLFAFQKQDQFDKGIAGAKTAAIALVGIGLSWIVVRFIFYIISIIA